MRLLLTFLERGTVRDISITSGELKKLPNLTLESSHACHTHQDIQGVRKPEHLSSSNGRRSIAGIDSVSRAGYTPFHLAARRHHYSVCDELLGAGAHLNAFIKPDLNKDSDVDYTLLVAAANSNDMDLVR